MKENHRRFARGLYDPGLTDFVPRAASEVLPGILQPSSESVHDHGIALAVNGILDFPDHPRQAGGRQATLEHRFLHAASVALAHLRDPAQSQRTLFFRVRDVVDEENVHVSGENERRIRRKIAAQMSSQQRRLDGGYGPTAYFLPQNLVFDLFLLLLFPQADQPRSRVVRQIDASARHPGEVLGPHLLAPNQGNNETIGQCPEFFGQIQRQGWTA